MKRLITKSEQRADFTRMILQLLAFMVDRGDHHGVLVYQKEVERHPCAQEIYYRNNVSKTRSGMHPAGLATDIVIISHDSKEALWDHEIFDAAGKFWESIGGKWGGKFSWAVNGHKDRDHFQYDRKRRRKYLEGQEDAEG